MTEHYLLWRLDTGQAAEPGFDRWAAGEWSLDDATGGCGGRCLMSGSVRSPSGPGGSEPWRRLTCGSATSTSVAAWGRARWLTTWGVGRLAGGRAQHFGAGAQRAAVGGGTVEPGARSVNRSSIAAAGRRRRAAAVRRCRPCASRCRGMPCSAAASARSSASRCGPAGSQGAPKASATWEALSWRSQRSRTQQRSRRSARRRPLRLIPTPRPPVVHSAGRSPS
jgi:hypothetical protein